MNASSNNRFHHRRAVLAGLLTTAVGSMVSAAPRTDRIVLGQTLALGAGSDGSAARVVAGTLAAVGAANAGGGINGKLLELVTLDGGKEPANHARHARSMIQEQGALAILNTSGDATCLAVSGVARELQVPMIGAFSGTRDMRRSKSRYLFPIRPTPERQADALIRQLRGMGLTRVALLTEQGARAELVDFFSSMLEKAGIVGAVITIDRSAPASLEVMLKELGTAQHQAVVLDLSADTIELLVERDLTGRPEWPRILAALANQPLVTISGAFPDRVIGFVNVVPNPEGATPLARQFQLHAERHSSGQAVTFDGFEAYINTLVCISALKRVIGTPSAARLVNALESLDRLDLGGLRISFGSGRDTGSDMVDVGMRSRSGHFLR